MKAGECREIVWRRDGGCVAPRLDPDAGECRDRWGRRLLSGSAGAFEMDYVRHPKLRRHEDPEAHVILCPGHHRGTGPSAGRQWATANRGLLRRHLARLYPALWRSTRIGR